MKNVYSAFNFAADHLLPIQTKKYKQAYKKRSDLITISESPRWLIPKIIHVTEKAKENQKLWDLSNR